MDQTDLMTVARIGGMPTSILALKVSRSEKGKVIGKKKDRAASALRTILNAASAKASKRAVIEIKD